jgi:hypothetical protein
MLETVPINAYLICYGPLALTVGGFILFALITDTHARRRYLRRLDPRVEVEQIGRKTVQVQRRKTIETPAGYDVTLLPPEEQIVTRETVTVPPTPTTPPPPSATPPAAPQEPPAPLAGRQDPTDEDEEKKP